MNGKISNRAQIASIQRYTISEGSEKGLDVIDCNSGRLHFLINVSKACDIMQLYHDGENMSFVSKNGFTKREIGFLNRFEGGMLYTCGLDSVGGREGYELHGTLHNTPARITRAEVTDDEVVLEALIRNSALFGKNLVLKRKIFSAIGGDTLHVEDTLVNEGYTDEKYCLLYHVNVGYPMLDAGAKIVADVANYLPRTPWAKQNEANMYEISDPVVCEEECCYFLELNKPEISLENKKNGKRFTLCYSKDTLPSFVEWKSMASGDYALGLEPCTTKLDDYFEYRTIKPDEKIKFSLSISVNELN